MNGRVEATTTLTPTDPVQDRRTSFCALVIHRLLAATDGHAKNFSLFLLPKVVVA